MSERIRPGANDPNFSARGRTAEYGRPVISHRTTQVRPIRDIRPPSHIKTDKTAKPQSDRPTIRRQASLHKPAMPRTTRSSVLSRQVVAPKKRDFTPKGRKKKISSFSLKNSSLIASAFIFLGLSGWSMKAHQWLPVGGVKGDTTSKEISIAYEESAIDDSPVTVEDIAAYKVSAELPRTVKINKLQLYARVAHIPLMNDGRVRPPTNVHDTGWLSVSSKPGEAGVMVVSGHVHGAGSPGVFNRLGNLREGDIITVERGDGKPFNYKVVKSVIYDNDKVDTDSVMSPAEAGKPGLNLVSHSNRYDVNAGKYEQRLVVFASLQ